MITHPDKVLFPANRFRKTARITKGEVAAYYDDVAEVMVPHVRKRPVTMERFPAGIGRAGFLQKDVSKGFPDWLERAETPRKTGGTVHYPLVNDRESLQWVANQNAITLHVWPSRVPKLDRPDICIFDLDPSADEPKLLREAAIELRVLLAEHGQRSWIKTSGSKGFHIAVRLRAGTTFAQSEAFAEKMAAELVARSPKTLTLEFLKSNRKGRILVDTMRNRMGATYAAPYTLRARPGAPVSAPITWEELESGRVHPQRFTLKDMAKRIAKVGDLWSGLL